MGIPPELANNFNNSTHIELLIFFQLSNYYDEKDRMRFGGELHHPTVGMLTKFSSVGEIYGRTYTCLPDIPDDQSQEGNEFNFTVTCEFDRNDLTTNE